MRYRLHPVDYVRLGECLVVEERCRDWGLIVQSDLGSDRPESTVTTNCVRHGKLLHDGFGFFIYFGIFCVCVGGFFRYLYWQGVVAADSEYLR